MLRNAEYGLGRLGGGGGGGRTGACADAAANVTDARQDARATWRSIAVGSISMRLAFLRLSVRVCARGFCCLAKSARGSG